MKRFLATRFGFFGFAAVVCWSTLLVIDADFRWVSIAVGGLYGLLSALFFIEDITRGN